MTTIRAPLMRAGLTLGADMSTSYDLPHGTRLISVAKLDTLSPLLRDWVEDCLDSMEDDPLGWFVDETWFDESLATLPPEHQVLFAALLDCLFRGHSFPTRDGYPWGSEPKTWKRLYRHAEKLAKRMQAKYDDLPKVDGDWRLIDTEETHA